MDAKRIEKFRKLVESCPNGIAILIAQIDPDAIGTAVLLRKALEALEKRVEIYYAGKVSQLNRAVFSLFDLDKIFHPLPNTLSSNLTLALVDSSMSDDARFGTLGKIDPRFVIDHHKGDIRDDAEHWVEIQGVGSASAIAADLCFSLELYFADDGDTAILGAMGIASDTDELAAPETKSLDRHMHAKLMDFGDQDTYHRARKYQLPERYYDILKAVLDSRRSAHSTLIASGGCIAEDEKDFLARIANNLMRAQGMTCVYVWAVVDEEKLVVKARTTDASTDLDQDLKREFGEKFAGAKTWQGGAEIPLGVLAPSGENSKEQLLHYLDTEMRAKFRIA